MLHALIELLSAGIEAVLSAGKDIPVGICIACIRTPGVAKQAFVLPLIGAARQKQCQTDNGKVSFPASQKSYQNKFSHSCAIITPSANERTPHRSFMRPAVRRGPVGGNLCQQIGHLAVAPALFDQSCDPILTGAATRRAFDPKSAEKPPRSVSFSPPPLRATSSYQSYGRGVGLKPRAIQIMQRPRLSSASGGRTVSSQALLALSI